MYFQIPANIVIYLFVIFIALIQLSRCGSFVTVTEDEAVQLEFPYPCDSNKVTIQSANRAPFYSSTDHDNANLQLPNYQLPRFSVTDGNCSVQVDINPVKRNDEATYICQAYKDGVIQGRFTRTRLNVNYPPGDVSCTFSIDNDAVAYWMPLQCTAPVGSLEGGIYCYQDSKRLPPRSNLVQIGDTFKQTVWVSKEVHPVFCCSVILDRPKDMCECTDFVWDPMGYISHTKTTIDPCPATTPVRVLTLPQYPEREVGDNLTLPQVIESLNLTDINKDKLTANSTVAVSWRGVIANRILLIILVTISLLTIILHFQDEKANPCFLKRTLAEHKVTVGTCSQGSQTSKKEPVLPTLSSNDNKSWRGNSKEKILTTKGLTKSKSTSAMPMDWV